MQVGLQLMIICIGLSDHFNIFVFTLSKRVNRVLLLLFLEKDLKPERFAVYVDGKLFSINESFQPS